MSSIINRLRTMINTATAAITDATTPSSSSDSSPTSPHIPANTVIDLTCLDNHVSPDVLTIIHSYISVLNTHVITDNRAITVHADADVPVLAMAPPDDSVWVDSVEVYTHSHDQGFCSVPGSASYSFFDLEIQTTAADPPTTDTNQHTTSTSDTPAAPTRPVLPRMVCVMRERCIDNRIANREFHHYVKRYNTDSTVVTQMNTNLRQVLVLRMRAMCPAWANFVRQTAIKIEYVTSYSPPTAQQQPIE